MKVPNLILHLLSICRMGRKGPTAKCPYCNFRYHIREYGKLRIHVWNVHEDRVKGDPAWGPRPTPPHKGSPAKKTGMRSVITRPTTSREEADASFGSNPEIELIPPPHTPPRVVKRERSPLVSPPRITRPRRSPRQHQGTPSFPRYRPTPTSTVTSRDVERYDPTDPSIRDRRPRFEPSRATDRDLPPSALDQTKAGQVLREARALALQHGPPQVTHTFRPNLLTVEESVRLPDGTVYGLKKTWSLSKN